MRGPAVALLTVALAARVSGASAVDYPDHTVRIIVPTAPAGAIDGTARALGAKLAERWGQPVVIDNKPGANMAIGTDLAAESAPDGYTLLVAHDGAMAMNPATTPGLPYDPMRDFAPVTLISELPFVLLVNKTVAAETAENLIALARQNPGRLNHASGGPAAQMAFALFRHMAAIDVVDIAYKGGALAVTSVMAGETQLALADIASASAGLESDKIRVLGVSSAARLARLPDLPTLRERAVPDYEYVVWIGVFAPAGTPNAIQAKIEADARAALNQPGLRARLEALQMEVRALPAGAFRARLAADVKKWSDLVRETGLRPTP